MDPRICIIGAGISGLAVGHYLMKAGIRSVIFEKESFVGGRMGSEEIEGFVIDKGAYTLPEFHKTTIELVKELGIEGSLKETSGTSSTFRNRKEYKIKIGSPMDFLKYKLLSLKNKKDMMKLFLYATSLGNSLNLYSPSGKTIELEKESASEYLLREYNEEILEYIAYPIFCEIFLGTPENNSKAAFLATIRNLTRFKIFSLDQGLGMLPEHLRKKLDVHLNSPALKVRQMDEQGPHIVDLGGDSPMSLTFEIVVFAVPMPIVVRIFDDLPPAVKEHLQKVRYAPSIVIVFAMNQPFPHTSFINNLLRKDFRSLGTVVFDHQKGYEHVPSGKSLVTVILSENGSRSLFKASESSIKNEVLKEIELLFPDFSSKLLFSKVYKWEHGAIQLKPGTLLEQTLMKKALKDHSQRIFFASDGLNKSSIEFQIKTAIEVANQIAKEYRGL